MNPPYKGPEFRQVLAQKFALCDQKVRGVTLGPPKDLKRGDLTTNAAMILAKPLEKSLEDMGDILVEWIQTWPQVDAATRVAGYINITLKISYWQGALEEILQEKSCFGGSNWGKDQRVNIEYVSANPTGPLHVGHGRIAVVGDVLAKLLDFTGHQVTKEYYVNDAGRQIDHLAASVYWHYCNILQDEPDNPFPTDGYRGEYIADLGQRMVETYGDRYLTDASWVEVFKQYAIESLLKDIQGDLDTIKVRQDVFTYESAVVPFFAQTLKKLEEKGRIYQGQAADIDSQKGTQSQEILTLFRTDEDKDRPLTKADGSLTYFATDMAYHDKKIQESYDILINVWGADHGNYVLRMQDVVRTLSPTVQFKVVLCQMVQFYDQGQAVRMSKRTGDFLALRDVVHHLGADVFRFLMITQSPHTHMRCNMEDILDQSKDNPVFYIQYAYARVCSVFRAAEAIFGPDAFDNQTLQGAQFHHLEAEDWRLVKKLYDWPQQVQRAVEAYEPHRLCLFLFEVAKAFHSLWALGKTHSTLRFIDKNDREKTRDKLAMLQGLRWVIRSGLNIFGVAPREEMGALPMAEAASTVQSASVVGEE